MVYTKRYASDSAKRLAILARSKTSYFTYPDHGFARGGVVFGCPAL
jgi:hypothetical protein